MGRKFTLTASADGDPSLESFGGIRGGRYEVPVEAAVRNSATVVIQMRNLRGTAWGDVSNEFTEDGSGALDFGQGDILKARVTGGVPAGLRIALRQFA